MSLGLDEGRHPWVSFDPRHVSVDSPCDQLMVVFLDYIEPDMWSHGHFYGHTFAVAREFCRVFGFNRQRCFVLQ